MLFSQLFFCEQKLPRVLPGIPYLLMVKSELLAFVTFIYLIEHSLCGIILAA